MATSTVVASPACPLGASWPEHPLEAHRLALRVQAASPERPQAEHRQASPVPDSEQAAV